MKILDMQFEEWKLTALTVEHNGRLYQMVDKYLLDCAKESNELLSNVNADLSERHTILKKELDRYIERNRYLKQQLKIINKR